MTQLIDNNNFIIYKKISNLLKYEAILGKKKNIKILNDDEKEYISNNIFKFEIKRDLSDVNSNIDLFPIDYKYKILKLVSISKFSEKYFIHYLKFIIENKYISKLPIDIIKIINSYCYTLPENIYYEVREYCFFMAIKKIINLIEEIEFELRWYYPGASDYYWAEISIKKCDTLINKILNLI